MRALLSVTDKQNLETFATGLSQAGWELVATGGTAKLLSEAGLAITEVAELTGYPAILDGRVKTLHPAVFGGILADTGNPQHLADMQAHQLDAFDLVVCNLYDFASAPGVENIDIGGPSMLRAAAKNHASVAVVIDPRDYDWVLAELVAAGELSLESRRKLAVKVFETTTRYDAQIAAWLKFSATGAGGSGTTELATEEAALPVELTLTAQQTHLLRYGENPDQQGARYALAGQPSWFDQAELLNGSPETGGKGLSYLNLLDVDAAWQLAGALSQLEPPTDADAVNTAAAVAVKHTNPCGAALGNDLATAWQKAYSCDPVSVFGGVVAFNQTITAELAEQLAGIFLEVVVAPGYEPQALDLLKAKKNLRVLQAPDYTQSNLDIRSAAGGWLVQTPPDSPTGNQAQWEPVTQRQPTPQELTDLAFAWTVVAATQSNAIVIARNAQAIGVGAGQQNRKSSVDLAAQQASEHSSSQLSGSVCASDAFFPFRDGLDQAAQAGCTAVIQPGGSVRDDEVIEAANEHNMAMLFTHQRCFKH